MSPVGTSIVAVSGVSTYPGSITVARIPAPPSSRSTDSASDRRAALAALYAAKPGTGTRPATEPTTTNRAMPWRMRGVPERTDRRAEHLPGHADGRAPAPRVRSSAEVSTAVPGRPPPTATTTRSRPPCTRSCSATARSSATGLPASATTATTLTASPSDARGPVEPALPAGDQRHAERLLRAAAGDRQPDPAGPSDHQRRPRPHRPPILVQIPWAPASRRAHGGLRCTGRRQAHEPAGRARGCHVWRTLGCCEVGGASSTT